MQVCSGHAGHPVEQPWQRSHAESTMLDGVGMCCQPALCAMLVVPCAACSTFLKTAEDQCMRPLSGGLTLTIQALLYQFAQPKGIKEADTEALVRRVGTALPQLQHCCGPPFDP